MHLVINKSKHGKKIYNSVLLRESYRENGKVKKRTIANLSSCTKEEIEAIALALKNKADLKNLINVREDILLEEGLSVGAVWVLYQTTKLLGIDKALGDSFSGKLALWQIMARALDQGSRLSAVRLAKVHAFGDVLGLDRGFSEDDLYDNLGWLSDNQERIENRLYGGCKGKRQIFLYDVTSSYLEGEQNYFGAYGYNRDGKKNKKQIVIGLLCDEEGNPLSVEVFSGNTQDICNNRQDKFNRIKEALEEISGLDGCYALKTDLPESIASKKTIHDRYKDLALVEYGFRTCKTDFLEVRPVYVRNEKNTRGHVFAVMLAYMIIRHLKEAWKAFDVTPEEGIKQLATLSSVEVKVKNRGSVLKIPRPREQSRELLKALNITLPTVLPHRNINVDTSRKLIARRKK